MTHIEHIESLVNQFGDEMDKAAFQRIKGCLAITKTDANFFDIRVWYAFGGGEELGVPLEKASIIWDACQKVYDNRGVCYWKHDEFEGYWVAECGMKWCFPEGTPFQNGMRYCPKCGKKLRRKD